MITPLFVMFRKTILTQEVTMDFYFLINCSISLYNGPFYIFYIFSFFPPIYKNFFISIHKDLFRHPKKGG